MYGTASVTVPPVPLTVRPVVTHVPPPFVDFSRVYTIPSCVFAADTVVASGQQPALGAADVVTFVGSANTVLVGVLVSVVAQKPVAPSVAW